MFVHMHICYVEFIIFISHKVGSVSVKIHEIILRLSVPSPDIFSCYLTHWLSLLCPFGITLLLNVLLLQHIFFTKVLTSLNVDFFKC